MAVTLTADDFLQPDGELSEDLFPGNDGDTATSLNTLINGWLQQAIAKIVALTTPPSDEDAAAAAWVYYRAYDHVAKRLMSSASSATIDSVSRSMAVDQRKFFADLAAAKLALFEGMTPTALDGPAIPAFFGLIKARRCYV